MWSLCVFTRRGEEREDGHKKPEQHNPRSQQDGRRWNGPYRRTATSCLACAFDFPEPTPEIRQESFHCCKLGAKRKTCGVQSKTPTLPPYHNERSSPAQTKLTNAKQAKCRPQPAPPCRLHLPSPPLDARRPTVATAAIPSSSARCKSWLGVARGTELRAQLGRNHAAFADTSLQRSLRKDRPFLFPPATLPSRRASKAQGRKS